VDPVLQKNTPIYQYAPNTWGPDEVERVTPPGGWHNPTSVPEMLTASVQAA
jgi:glucose-6-phosphate 1-dehydrogenase